MREDRPDRYIVAFAILLLAIMVIASGVQQLDEAFFGNDTSTGTHAAWRTVIYAIAAFVGFILLAWRSYNADQQTKIANRQTETALRQTELIERGQATDRLTKAVEQLSSDKLYERIGGVHALKQIARTAQEAIERNIDDNRYHQENLEVARSALCEFVRTPPYESLQRQTEAALRKKNEVTEDNLIESDWAALIPIRCPDIVAAFATLQIIALPNINDKTPSLHNVKEARLWGLDLRHASMDKLNMSRAEFWGADLTGASLKGTTLDAAQFQDATLIEIDLSDANLEEAEMANVILVCANMWGTDLRGANLQNADLSWAELHNAVLEATGLQGTKFNNSWLRNVDFRNTELEGASFAYADLSNTDFTYATCSDKADWNGAWYNFNLKPIGLPEVTSPQVV